MLSVDMPPIEPIPHTVVELVQPYVAEPRTLNETTPGELMGPITEALNGFVKRAQEFDKNIVGNITRNFSSIDDPSKRKNIEMGLKEISDAVKSIELVNRELTTSLEKFGQSASKRPVDKETLTHFKGYILSQLNVGLAFVISAEERLLALSVQWADESDKRPLGQISFKDPGAMEEMFKRLEEQEAAA